MTMRTLSLGLLTIMLVCGCERESVTNAAPSAITGPAAASLQQAYLSVSDSAPRAGAMFVVAAKVSAKAGSAGIASYRVRLFYDTASVSLVDIVDQADVIQAVNPTPGEVIVAGVNTKPSLESTLLIARFVARTATNSLAVRLETNELNDAGYQSVLATTPTNPRHRQDPSLSRLLSASLK